MNLMKSFVPAWALFTVVSSAPLRAAEEKVAPPSEFDTAIIRFEQNATDGDVEAVFEVVGDDDGLTELKIVSPDGRTIVDVKSPEENTMGIREFRFESPEPTDVAALKKAFPEGAYTFTGTTTSTLRLKSNVKLSHALPPTTSFVSPKAKARNVVSKGLKITWAAVKGVKGYLLELSPTKSSAHLEVMLPASITSFTVPEGVLVAGDKCQLAIGTVSAGGNVSSIETEFSTAAGK